MGLFDRILPKKNGEARLLESGPKKGRLKNLFGRIFQRTTVDDAFWAEMEEALLTADVGIETTEHILDAVRDVKGSVEEVRARVRSVMREMLFEGSDWRPEEKKPFVIMAVGVNGVGKTTTIAKLAAWFKALDKSVQLVAADTFRAAAIDQLQIWGDRLQVPVIASQPEADPAAVAFDGIRSAIARNVDVVIMDTAGRLHTKKNLMEELKKISRIVDRECPGAPHEKLLLIDATVGQNGLVQAREFHSVLGLTGAVVAKMDGTAKGGVIFPIVRELKLPVRFLGVGEGVDDLQLFDPDEFISEIL